MFKPKHKPKLFLLNCNQKEEEDDSPKPRPLHKTSSIFLRNLAPTITMQEVSFAVTIHVSQDMLATFC